MATALREQYETLRAWPRLDALEETVRKGRRAAATARAAAEDAVADASLRVRRRPLTAVGIAASVGFATGCLGGFAAAWFVTRRG